MSLDRTQLETSTSDSLLPDVAPDDTSLHSLHEGVPTTSLESPSLQALASEVSSADSSPSDVSPAVHQNACSTPDVHDPLGPPSDDLTLLLDSYELSERTLVHSSMWSYLVMLVQVIEGQTMPRAALLAWLRTSLRQRSIGRAIRREYVLQYLHEHPPPEPRDEPIRGTNEL